MLRALALSLGQLPSGAFLRVLALSLAMTIALFAGLGAAAWLAADALVAALAGGRSAAAATAFAVVVTGLALWLAFRAVAVLVIGLFADTIVAAVEAHHYPEALATARDVPIARSLAMGLGSAARFVGVNLLLLPAYLLLLATGVGTAALFMAANAWLLGRDLGDMVAARHRPAAALPTWRAQTRGRRFLLGLGGTALFLVPGLNLLAPLLGAAMATHLYHGAMR